MARPRFRTDGLLTRTLIRARLGAALGAIPPGARVLDVGCGLTDLAARLPAYVGCDRWGEVLEENRRRHPEARFFEWDVLASDAPSEIRAAGPFDAVLMLALLEHLSDPAAALRRAAAHLAAGGRILVTTPHPVGRAPLEAGAALGLLSRHAAEEHDALLGRAELSAAGEAAGLALASYRRFLFGLNQLAVFERKA